MYGLTDGVVKTAYASWKVFVSLRKAATVKCGSKTWCEAAYRNVHAMVRRKKTIMVRSNGESDMAFLSKKGCAAPTMNRALNDARLGAPAFIGITQWPTD